TSREPWPHTMTPTVLIDALSPCPVRPWIATPAASRQRRTRAVSRHAADRAAGPARRVAGGPRRRRAARRSGVALAPLAAPRGADGAGHRAVRGALARSRAARWGAGQAWMPRQPRGDRRERAGSFRCTGIVLAPAARLAAARPRHEHAGRRTRPLRPHRGGRRRPRTGPRR